MLSFAELLAQGASHAWLFIPSAILLGALHGLEPGHSKTMMAAFIVAIRGTVWQAVLLGVTATISHTLIVWGIGLGGMYLWQGVAAEELEPYFQLASGAVIVLIAAWMFWRTWREQHGEAHDHSHHDHEHGGHTHDDDAALLVPHGHQHDQNHEALRGLNVAGVDHQDAHQLAHANDIRRRFANRNVTNWQIALFGLTGGLIPCPAAITVLLLCLQLKAFTLGAVLVLCFSIGLAITLVTVGVVAALSVRHVTRRAPWFSAAARRAPYLSSLLIVAVGIYVGLHGWLGLP
ncbi:nickel/cobalt efflux transporter RcnA [Achromobacter sp. Marseille-Q0513]|uniref:nickel/cobalt efflux transporter n=1 Tax=Achromobacter sp. Marseille-Q0513 TaxID=2829161 RepID=UPI001B977B97|nr:nickel/cobalt efflux transporter [Achromobacter sp. Marseille-Q0513]MBR8655175.1 nickel/cobalt efflux transporter RcnA [Achromobacter sp. Marseille-Q0513]